jgi:mannose-1-phosphate guanylyltransferase
VSGETWVVVLAGGIGSRFWPMSTPERPKQLLPLLSSQSMLADTIARISTIAPPERTMILTNASLVDAVRVAVPTIPAENVIAEPRPAGTAAALTWAAQRVAARGGLEAVMISVHADSAITDVPRFRSVLSAAAAAAARHHALVTVGIVPRHADTGLGYIECGAVVDGVLRKVSRFLEKPTGERAAQIIAAGGLWNSGILAWRVVDLLDEIRALCPEIAPSLAAHPDDAVLERSAKVMVIPGDFGWSDVGTWASLRDVRDCDVDGNAVLGATFLQDSSGNVVHAEGATVVLYGVDDLVVVRKDGVTLVTTIEKSGQLKTLLDALPTSVRGQ